jgi:hypothetical protein
MIQQGIMFNTLTSVPLNSTSVQTAPSCTTSDHLQRCMDSVQELAKTIAFAMDGWHGRGLLACSDIHGLYAKVSANLEQLPTDVECMRCTRRTYKSALHNPPSRVSSLSSACTCDANSEPAKRRRTSGAPHELAVTDQTKPLTAEHNHAPLIPHTGLIAAASGERNCVVISSSAAQGTSQRRGGRERNSHLSADAKDRSAKMRKLAAPKPARKRVGRVEQQQQQQQPADISSPQTQAGASGADASLDLEMPILNTTQVVGAPKCRDGDSPDIEASYDQDGRRVGRMPVDRMSVGYRPTSRMPADRMAIDREQDDRMQLDIPTGPPQDRRYHVPRPPAQAGASGADTGLDLEMPILKVSRPVAACPRCRTAKTKCDGKLPVRMFMVITRTGH